MTGTLSGSIRVYLVCAASCGLAAACETITRRKLQAEEETMSWCRVCGRYDLFGVCPMQDPPYPGLVEKTIAAAKPPPPVAGPEISLDGRPSVRLQTRGQQ